jgi:hypothetical protein
MASPSPGVFKILEGRSFALKSHLDGAGQVLVSPRSGGLNVARPFKGREPSQRAQRRRVRDG